MEQKLGVLQLKIQVNSGKFSFIFPKIKGLIFLFVQMD